MSREDLNLADIPGLGPVRRDALAEAGIHDLEGLLRLKVAELAAIRGVGAWQARRIAEFLRQRGLALQVETPDGQSAVVVTAPRSAEEAAVVEEAVETLSAQAALEAELEYQVEQLEEAAAEDRDLEETEALNDEETALLDAVGESEPTASDTGKSPRRSTRKGKASKSRVRTAKEKGKNAAESPVDTGEAEAFAAAAETALSESAPEASSTTDGELSTKEAEAKPASSPAVVAGVDNSLGGEPQEGTAEEVDEEVAIEAEENDTVNWQGRIREQREQLPEAALELMEAIRAAAVSKQLTRQITRLLITAGEFITDSRPLTPEQRQAASEALDQAERALRRAVERRSFGENQQKDLASRIRRRRKELEELLESKLEKE